MNELIIRRPDDWHLHLRDGAMLKTVVPYTAAECQRAIVMPNLVPPVTDVAMANAYRERVLAALPAGSSFDPLMTLYLTDKTTTADIHAAAADPHVHAVKLYPAGATTNSDSGVRDPLVIDAVYEALQETGLPLLVHGEVVDSDIDIFDREKVFIDRVLDPVLRRYPNMKVVMEHITTADAAAFVSSQSERVGATITAHHLLYNRNAMLVGGIRPHYYCLPVLKRERHREALVEAATSGEGRFFMGTDSAPHPKDAKESACGCAGAFTAHAALAFYAEAFDQVGRLDRLEAFTSLNGPRFYGLPVNYERVKLVRRDVSVPDAIEVDANTSLVPLRAGESVSWAVEPT